MMDPVFELNGETFQVDVVSLEREFSMPLAETAGRTLDGVLHHKVQGPYYSYTLTVAPRPGCEGDMDLLWDQVTLPVVYNCRFPYGDGVIDTDMYVTGAKQQLLHTGLEGNRWGGMTLQFLGTVPGGGL